MILSSKYFRLFAISALLLGSGTSLYMHRDTASQTSKVAMAAYTSPLAMPLQPMSFSHPTSSMVHVGAVGTHAVKGAGSRPHTGTVVTHAHHRVTKSAGAGRHLTPPHATVSATAASAAHNEDLYWLSRVIEAEAGGETQNVKIAVGDVIVNRTHSKQYPSTIHNVIFQYAYGVYEFTSVENGWIYHTPSAASVQAAKTVLYQHVNIVPSALVFYDAAKTPTHSWVRQQPYLTQLGSMTFAR